MSTTATTSAEAVGAMTADQAPPRDLRRFWRVTAAIMLPLGPLLVTILRATMPYWTSDDTAAVVEKSLANPGPLELASWLILVAVPALLVGVITIGYLARRGAPVLATVGTILAFAGFLALGGLASTDALVVAGGKIGMEAPLLERLTTTLASDPAASVGTGIFIVGHIVGLVLLGIALRKARIVPLVVAIVIAVSQPVHLVAAVIVPSRLLDVVFGWGFTTIGFAAVALVVLRMRDDEWDAAPARVAG